MRNKENPRPGRGREPGSYALLSGEKHTIGGKKDNRIKFACLPGKLPSRLTAFLNSSENISAKP